MPRLIDADKLRKDVLDLPNCYNGFSDTYDKACIIDMIDEQPTVNVCPYWDNESDYCALNKPSDAGPVVRCKECKHYYADPWGYGNCVFEGGVSRRTKDSDFCSWGERREDADN